MLHQSAIFEKQLPPFCQIWIISHTWSCGSRQRDTNSSGWKFGLNDLAVEGLTFCAAPFITVIFPAFWSWLFSSYYYSLVTCHHSQRMLSCKFLFGVRAAGALVQWLKILIGKSVVAGSNPTLAFRFQTTKCFFLAHP